MTTLTIEISEKAGKTLADLVEQLGGKVISVNPDSKDIAGLKAAKKLSRKEQKYLKEFDEAIEFINQHQQGKVKAKTLDELLDEL